MPERPPADGGAPDVVLREIGPADEAELTRFLEEKCFGTSIT
jgi:hypothetical protein